MVPRARPKLSPLSVLRDAAGEQIFFQRNKGLEDAHTASLSANCRRCFLRRFSGAQGRTRTGTSFRTADFKSAASTNSATRAWPNKMEARVGIEPAYTELQSAA